MQRTTRMMATAAAAGANQITAWSPFWKALFLLLPPSSSLPLTARASILKQKKGEKRDIDHARPKPLPLCLSLYKSKRLRNKIVKRRHLSTPFRGLEREGTVPHSCGSPPQRHEILPKRLKSRMCPRKLCNIKEYSRSLPSYIVSLPLLQRPWMHRAELCARLPIVCCKWSRIFRRMRATWRLYLP